MKYQVWYMRPETFRDGILGKTFDAANLANTHIHLKDVEADGVEAAYRQMQAEFWSPNGEARALIEAKGLQHTSMSVGDVIVDDVGNAHLVATMGFTGIGGVRRGWQDRAMSATRGTQLGAIIACALGRETPPPYFSGKASVTSDGFIMCNFTAANGDGHMGAFVGSMTDLQRNVEGLSDHLQLDEQERDELTQVIGDWIGLDYRSRAARQ